MAAQETDILQNVFSESKWFPGKAISLIDGIGATPPSPPTPPPPPSTQTRFFLMAGIDSSCVGPSPTYHSWIVQDDPDFTGSQAGTLPCGGPLTNVHISASWLE